MAELFTAANILSINVMKILASQPSTAQILDEDLCYSIVKTLRRGELLMVLCRD